MTKNINNRPFSERQKAQIGQDSEEIKIENEIYDAYLSGSRDRRDEVVKNLMTKRGAEEVISTLTKIIEKEMIDLGSGLPGNESFSRQLNKIAAEELVGEKKRITAKFFRTGGDEFVGLIKAKEQEPMLIYCDLAQLNLYNTLGGHAGGDEVIKAVGGSLRSISESIDLNKDNKELEKSLSQNISEKISEIDVNKFKNLPPQAPKVHLDFGLAKFSEAKEIYQQVYEKNHPRQVNPDEEKRILIDIFKKIADKRSDINKSLWRVEHLCQKARKIIDEAKKTGVVVGIEEDEKEMIVEEKKVDEKIKDLTERIKSSLIKTEEAQKELKIYQELKDQINFFYSEIKHSLKALHGLEKEDIFTLAKVEEESLRRRLSARMVKEKMKTEETERFLESKKLAELIFEKAFQG